MAAHLPAIVPANLHGTAIAMAGNAVLIRGRSGAGKSDLALRAVAIAPSPLLPHQALLVADDRVLASASGADVYLGCPSSLEGMIEVRGVGIVKVPFVSTAKLALVVDLVEGAAVDRLPEPTEPAIICGLAIPRLVLAPFESSAAIKLLLALERASRPPDGIR